MGTDVPIAVIGMACRFPLAPDSAELWQVVLRDQYAIKQMPPARFDRARYFDPEPGAYGKSYCLLGGLIDDHPFDPGQLRLPPRVVESTDIAHLWSLGVAHATFRDAGYPPDALARKNVGVVIGHARGSMLTADMAFATAVEGLAGAIDRAPSIARLDPAERNALKARVIDGIHGRYPRRTEDGGIGTMTSGLAGLISHTFELTGRHMVVDAACASSFAAADIGMRALAAGRLDLALVGGASYSQELSVIMFAQSRALSPDGSFPFDRRANGFISSDGIGFVLLKRLDDALRDGDRVRAVIRGIGGSCDGKGRALWAPRREGQVLAIQRAYRSSGIDPDSIGLIEAHATSTPLGDRTEIEALEACFDRRAKNKVLPIGSIKGNIGHCREAAGAAGLIKAILALEHATLPPTGNFREANAEIPWSEVSAEVITAPRLWKSNGGPRRAGVNAFGIGGLNYHVIVEEAPPKGRRIAVPADLEAGTAPPIDIAIVGIGGKFPGATNVEQFWANLISGTDVMTDVPESRWSQAIYYQPSDRAPYRTYAKRGAFIADFEANWRRYKVPPRLVERNDPLQFMVLESALDALDDARIDLDAIDRSRIGVVVGSVFGSDFALDLSLAIRAEELAEAVAVAHRGRRDPALEREILEAVRSRLPSINEDSSGSFSSSTLASRTSKTLDLMGPAYAIDAACASSLASLEAACELLRANAVDVAIYAGADRAMRVQRYEGYCQFYALSKSDRARPFDADADGFLPGEGAAVCVLERLEDAERNGHHVYAVIKGIGSAGNGERKTMHRPSARGLRTAIERALEQSAVRAEDVAFIECHGAGTVAGDATEVEVLHGLFEPQSRAEPLRLGSVKSNVGHTQGAAGAIAVVKTALVLDRGRIPPTLGFARPHPAHRFEQGLYVNREAEDFPEAPVSEASSGSEASARSDASAISEASAISGASAVSGASTGSRASAVSGASGRQGSAGVRAARPARRAGVSSMGLAGINYHAILERPIDGTSAVDGTSMSAGDRRRASAPDGRSASIMDGRCTSSIDSASTGTMDSANTSVGDGASTSVADGASTSVADGASTSVADAAGTSVAEGASTSALDGASTSALDGASTSVADGASTSALDGANTSALDGATAMRGERKEIRAAGVGPRAVRLEGEAVAALLDQAGFAAFWRRFGPSVGGMLKSLWESERARRAPAAISPAFGAHRRPHPRPTEERLSRPNVPSTGPSVGSNALSPNNPQRAALTPTVHRAPPTASPHAVPPENPNQAARTPAAHRAPPTTSPDAVPPENPKQSARTPTAHRAPPTGSPHAVPPENPKQAARAPTAHRALPTASPHAVPPENPKQAAQTPAAHRAPPTASPHAVPPENPKQAARTPTAHRAPPTGSPHAVAPENPKQATRMLTAHRAPPTASPHAVPPENPKQAERTPAAHRAPPTASPHAVLRMTPRVEPAPFPEGARESKSLRTEILHLRGTAREIGRQHGEAMRSRIREVMERYEAFLGATGLALLAVPQAIDRILACFDRSSIDELDGLAEGAGVRFRHLFAYNLDAALFPGYVAGCTQAVHLATANGGRMIHLVNEDSPLLLHLGGFYPRVIQFRHRTDAPRPEIQTVLFSVAGQSAGPNALNDRGLSVTSTTLLDAVPPAGAPTGLPHPQLVKRIIEEAESIDDALRIAHTAERVGRWSLLISDAEHDQAAYLEYDGQTVLFEERRIAGRRITTNHALAGPAEGSAAPEHSRHRACRAEELLESERPLGVETAKKALRDRVDRGRGGREVPYPTMNTVRRVDNVMSLVIEPNARRFHVTDRVTAPGYARKENGGAGDEPQFIMLSYGNENRAPTGQSRGIAKGGDAGLKDFGPASGTARRPGEAQAGRGEAQAGLEKRTRNAGEERARVVTDPRISRRSLAEVGEVMTRHVIRAIPEAPPPAVARVAPASTVILGHGPRAAAIGAAFRARGGAAYVEPDLASALARIDALGGPSAVDAVGVVLAETHTAAWALDASAWTERRRSTIEAPFALLRSWAPARVTAGRGGILFGVTALGGALGHENPIEGSGEGGALLGLIKSIRRELFADQPPDARTLVQVIDASPSEAPEKIAESLLLELDAGSPRLEVGLLRSKRVRLAMAPRPLSNTDDRPDEDPSRPLPRTWLVTGGARGVTARIAERLAELYRPKLHLLGKHRLHDQRQIESWRALDKNALDALKKSLLDDRRSRGAPMSPLEWRAECEAIDKSLEIDRAVRAMQARGSEVHYHSVDVADRAALAAALDPIRAAGSIEGLIHGAGVEVAKAFDKKSDALLAQTVGAKVDGLVHLLHLLENDPLTHVIGFSSVSGRFGGHGQTDYSLANEALARILGEHRARRSDRKVTAVSWPAFSEVGLAARSSAKAFLEAAGQAFMSPAEGANHLVRELAAGLPEAEITVCGKLDELDLDRLLVRAPDRERWRSVETAARRAPLLGAPLLIEKDRLIAERTASAEEPFLDQHRIGTTPILPAVIVLEILAEAARSSRSSPIPWISEVEILQPLKIAPGTSRVLRACVEGDGLFVAASVRRPDSVVLEPDRIFARGRRIQGPPEADIAQIVGRIRARPGTIPSDSELIPYPYPAQPDPSAGSHVVYHGPVLRCLEGVVPSRDRGRARLVVPPTEALVPGSTRADWAVPAALIDGCLQAVGMLGRLLYSAVALPRAFGRIAVLPRALEAVGEKVTLEVVFRGRSADALTADLVVFEGRAPILAIERYVAGIVPGT